MTNKFGADFRVGYNQLLPDSTLTLAGLMSYVQESSFLHTNSIPGAFDYYAEKGLVWVLTHWQVEIYKYPKVSDIINVSTWPSAFKGYFGERGYEVLSAASGERLLAANSNWILLDANAQKPARPDSYILEKYGQTHPLLIDKNFAMPKHDDFELVCEHAYAPTRRDMDTNMHVNNVSYLKWLYDFVPEDVYCNFVPKSLRVTYKKQTLPNDCLSIKIYKKMLGNEIHLHATIEKEGVLATEINSVWHTLIKN